jgi:O-antigen/teichoic acid export membrane protein
MGCFNLLNYFNNRKKLYKDLAKANVFKSITMAVIQLSLGFFKAGALGLVSGQLASQIASNTKLFFNIQRLNLFSKISKIKIIALAKRYKDFPKFSVWSTFFNTASVQLPILMLASFFSTSIVGFYSLSHRFISMPIVLIGASIGQVFFQKSATLKDDKEALKKLVLNTYQKLFKIGILPFSIIMIYGDYIFSFVFGEEWLIAGQYAQVLSIWILFVFITSPLTNLFATLEMQREALYFNIVMFISRIMIIAIGGLIIQDAYITILIYGISSALFWMFWGFYLLNIVGINYGESFIYIFRYLIPVILLLTIIRIYI